MAEKNMQVKVEFENAQNLKMLLELADMQAADLNKTLDEINRLKLQIKTETNDELSRED